VTRNIVEQIMNVNRHAPFSRRAFAQALALALAGAGLFAAPVAAQIYRCSDGATTIFSDRPCSADAELHEAETNISVITKAEGLDEIVASNQAFLEQRREAIEKVHERAAQRRAENQRRESRRAPVEYVPTHSRTVGTHLNGLRPFGTNRSTFRDPRTRAQRDRQTEATRPDERATLLSRSGGNRRNIIR